MTTYKDAAEVAEIGERMIREHHPELSEAEVRFVFRSEAAKSKGKVVLGKARKVTGLNAFLSDVDDDEFFVIEVAEDRWEDLDEAQRAALVDHELCHCTVDEDKDGNPKLKLRAHDLEEFHEIVVRHGLWQDDVESFAKAVNQQLTFEDG